MLIPTVSLERGRGGRYDKTAMFSCYKFTKRCVSFELKVNSFTCERIASRYTHTCTSRPKRPKTKGVREWRKSFWKLAENIEKLDRYCSAIELFVLVISFEYRNDVIWAFLLSETYSKANAFLRGTICNPCGGSYTKCQKS